MRTTTLIVAALMLALPLTALAPTASAVGWCVANGPPGHACHSHTFCWGWSWDSYGERCQVGIERGMDPCDLMTCGPGPVLP